jgi:hypothetical protein
MDSFFVLFFRRKQFDNKGSDSASNLIIEQARAQPGFRHPKELRKSDEELELQRKFYRSGARYC